MPAFPSVAYDVDLNSYEITYNLPPLVTTMEGGNVRQRSRPGDSVATVSQNLIMTNADWATVRAFAKTTITNGTERFTQSVWDGAAWQTGRTVQLTEPPKARPYTPNEVIVPWNLRVFDLV